MSASERTPGTVGAIAAFTRRVLAEQPVRFSAVIGTTAVAALLEGVGVAALVPLLQIMQSGAGAAAAAGTIGRILRVVLGVFGLPFGLVPVLGFILVLTLASQAVNLIQQRLAWDAIYGFESSLRRRLYRAVVEARWPFFLEARTGEVINALTVECGRAGMAYQYLTLTLSAIAVVVIYLVLAVAISWQMTLVTVIIGAAVIVVLRGRVSRGAVFGERVTRHNNELAREALENVSGAKAVKAVTAEEATAARFDGFASRLAVQQAGAGMNQAWVRVLYESVSITVILVGFYLAMVRFHMSIASVIVFALVFYRLSPRLSNLQANVHNALSHMAGLTVVDEITAKATAMREESRGDEVTALGSGLRFEGVGFDYGEDRTTLTGVRLDIAPGSTVAIVGPSGAGKTTIVDLMMGLIEPGSGRITLDGRPLGDYDVRSWRRHVGYVPQDAVLFHASVRENIAWGRDDVTDDEVERAARFAYADEFIREMPEGYATIVGDRGVRLSGGQRQRIALARAICDSPALLVLDEATSALDAESERKIQSAVENLAASVTVVIVTHRLATVRGADLLYVMDEGRVVESGTWEELAAADGTFARLMRLQGLDGSSAAEEGGEAS